MQWYYSSVEPYNTVILHTVQRLETLYRGEAAQKQRLTDIFSGDIREMAGGVRPSTCSWTRADSTISSRPTGHEDKHCSQTQSNISSEEEHKSSHASPSLPQAHPASHTFLFAAVLPGPWPRQKTITKKTPINKILYASRNIRLYCTGQCSNLSENLRSPSTDGSKGLWSEQTTRQRLHLLLCARQRHFSEEEDSHAAGGGKQSRTLYFSQGTLKSFNGLMTQQVCDQNIKADVDDVTKTRDLSSR